MSYKIIGKYIKELNFNIPNTKAFFLIAENISNYKVNIDIKSNQIKENIIEVLTTLSLSSVKDKIDKINTNIVFASVVEFKNNNIEKREIEKIILVKVLPRSTVNLEKYSYRFLKVRVSKTLKLMRM